MRQNKNVPQIRFEGFTDDWKQHKLGKVVQITMGQSPDGDTYSEIPSDYVLVQGNADLEDGWVKPRVWTTQITKQADIGDLIMSVRAPAGAMGKTAYSTVIGRGVAAIKGNEFIYQLLVKRDKEGCWRKDSTGSTFESLNSDSLKNAEIKTASNEEQQAIGEYFSKLDHLITLYRQKYEKFLDLKKAMLYKLFPKEGKTTPEVRFDGFSEEWEKRKLGDCFSERIESFPEGELLSVTINQGIKKFSELDRKNNSNDNKNKYKKVYIGDIAYNSMRMWQGASGYSPYEGIVSPAYTVLSPNDGIDSKCFSYLFKRADITHMFQIHSKGITSDNWNLKYPDFKELEVYVSRNYEEQKAIGEYFSKLDQLIALNKEKLEKLKNIKSLLLDKMFV
ncbi:MAG: restriction endonuclease subunit S [Negativicoccus succinicivorans]|uniref:restriction endonuclease subunit S n=1 Tax=Negativicoccus succinicivorans TaxID=620903 RepID=UPI0026F251FC|nr:restriction endonuclease subunit S [Negativicoccus succinicivorans]MBS5888008.1 restriction endonuclease subunit S [Negativicoccus succinicivorans]